MIGFARGSEPAALTTARTRQLARAIEAHDRHGAPSPELKATLTGYGARPIKLQLYTAQRKKCAWCERRRDFSSSPVEHYRPKDGAWRHLPGQARHVDAGHYWWLTWTWSNLLFSCARCNDRGHKANHFPLVAGTTACAAPGRPIGTALDAAWFEVAGESPALLDPSRDIFLDHIAWVPFNTSFARSEWNWSPKALTPRGAATIAILKLAELADDVKMHLVRSVLPAIEEVEQHLAERRTRQAAARWNALITLVEPEHELTAATWCALERWMPVSARRAHGLADPKRPA